MVVSITYHILLKFYILFTKQGSFLIALKQNFYVLYTSSLTLKKKDFFYNHRLDFFL